MKLEISGQGSPFIFSFELGNFIQFDRNWPSVAVQSYYVRFYNGSKLLRSLLLHSLLLRDKLTTVSNLLRFFFYYGVKLTTVTLPRCKSERSIIERSKNEP